jgi:ATP-dependent helicase/DNAse subunit B
MPDKYAATWVSHTSITDFLNCPRSYFLKNVYKDPKTNHKIQLMSPSLALGAMVHEVLESLSVMPTKDRFKESLIAKLDRVWPKVTGKKGGFRSSEQEHAYKQRAEMMLRRVMQHPGPLTNLAVKIKGDLPQFWLSETDEIILCGKIDWLEYFPESDSVHIIDFKTSKSEERESSLQLPIYRLLVDRCQHHAVEKASYWYLELRDELTPKELPDLIEAEQTVLEIAKKMKVARKLNVMKCPQGEAGCFFCKPFEKIVAGQAEFVGENDFRQDVYIAADQTTEDELPESEIL